MNPKPAQLSHDAQDYQKKFLSRSDGCNSQQTELYYGFKSVFWRGLGSNDNLNVFDRIVISEK